MNKTTVVVILLLFSLLLSLIFVSSKKAYALTDPMTLSQISGLAYALGSSFGLDFTMSGLTGISAEQYFESDINSWLGEHTILEKFGADQARIVAGKLVIPHLLYNGIKEFLESFVEENQIDTTEKSIVMQSGDYRVETLPTYMKPGSGRNYFVNQWGVTRISTGAYSVRTVENNSDVNYSNVINVGCKVENGNIYGVIYRIPKYGSPSYVDILIGAAGSTLQEISASFSGSIPETVLNPDQEWTGTIGGQDWPDTNIDQLIGQILDDVADNNLDVEGEVTPVVPPTPVPTPIPVDPDTPLSDVPWEGLNDLIDTSTGTIGEGIREQTDVITGAQEATTEAVESLTDTITGALDVPNSEELPDFKFDLRELFPFCIPFDIYRLLTSFDAEPIAPHVQIPFVIESLGFRYDIDLDFSVFNPVAEILRTVEFIVYALGLAWATGKVIKW